MGKEPHGRRKPRRQVPVPASDGRGPSRSHPLEAEARVERAGAVLVPRAPDELREGLVARSTNLVQRLLSGGGDTAGSGCALDPPGEPPGADLGSLKLSILECPLPGWGR